MQRCGSDRPRRGLLQNQRPAFTLLEVVLALALTVAVMAVVGVAIHLHLNSLSKSAVDIERTQLARTLLHRIADDLRSAVRSEPFDDSGITSVVGSASGISADDATKAAESAGLDAGALLGDASTEAGKSGSSSKSGSSTSGETSESEATTTTPSSTPGLYGGQYDLQVDVGRLPRPDELSAATMNGTSLPGDVRTVTYFLSAANAATGQTGLMRAELNRATALYQSENGDVQAMTDSAELVAGEVAALEFRYFDGTQWLNEWDSTASEGLPMAIEISIALEKPAVAADSESVRLTLGEYDTNSIYRLVVHLPNAQLPKESSSTTADSSGESSETKDLGNTTGSSSGSSGSSSSGTGGSGSGSSKSGSSKGAK